MTRRYFWQFWREPSPPTALELTVKALQDCRRDQLHQQHLQEYHAAMSKMLREREVRLLKDMDRFSKKLDIDLQEIS